MCEWGWKIIFQRKLVCCLEGVKINSTVKVANCGYKS